MSDPTIILKPVIRSDVLNISKWLSDDEVSENWFGRYSYGDPAHLGYNPIEVQKVRVEQWDSIFDSPEHRIFSIYTTNNQHIGEIHLSIEESLGDAQLSILIGDKKKWNQGYGTATIKEALKRAFKDWGLYRVWVDIPEYNEPALSTFRHLGFIHEGSLRKSRPHHGARFDSIVMGILAIEYGETPHNQSAIHQP